jgi:hypothetical protein
MKQIEVCSFSSILPDQSGHSLLGAGGSLYGGRVVRSRGTCCSF